MSKDPAILFYTADFLTGTMLMSDEQVGQYIRLLCLQHQKGHLSEKDMFKICGAHDDDIWAKFKLDQDGLYYNEVLDDVIDKRRKYSESRANNRKGKTKPKHKKNICKSYDKHMENENENENVKGIKIEKRIYRDNVLLSEAEYNKLIERDGKVAVNWMLDKLYNYKLANGKKYVSDYGAINSWVRDEYNKQHFSDKPKAQAGA